MSATVKVGELLTRLRLARGMSQEQLARASGAGVRSISDIERGRVRQPQRRTLAALADALDLTSAESDQLLRVEWVARPRGHGRIAPPVVPVIGRGADLGQITRLLTVAGARLVTVVGPAGVGKSHLAAAALDRLAAVTSTFTVECQGGGVADVLAGLARATASRPVPAATATVDDVVVAVGRDRVGILLDDVHPLPEVSCVLAALLARCPRLQLVLTARTAARIRGEHQWPLAGLMGEDAIALLVERAVQARPGFAGTAANAAELAWIVDRLAGNPLGIEIAAALLRGRDSTELDRTLAAVLPASGDPLPALLQWRIGRLPHANRAVLTVLSGYPAGAVAVEAQAAAGDDWDDLVAALAGAALLRVTDRDGRCWLRVPGAVRDVVADGALRHGDAADRNGAWSN